MSNPSAPKRIAVFCGSQPGADPAYMAAANEVGRILAEKRIEIVYGGGRVGLMGAVADGALEAGGRVIGVIPRALEEAEIAHRGVTELIVVKSMHQRKETMAKLSDAFVALPGGIGTYEELFEQWTWGKLAIHSKPTIVLDTLGYFGSLRAMVTDMVQGGFLGQTHADMLQFIERPQQIVQAVTSYEPPTGQWSGIRP